MQHLSLKNYVKGTSNGVQSGLVSNVECETVILIVQSKIKFLKGNVNKIKNSLREFRVILQNF